MDHSHSPVDLESESPKHTDSRQQNGTHSSVFLEAAALLTIWSILVINEGAIRVIDTNPAGGLSGGRPATALVFVGGLVEVVFGLLGLFLGLAGFILRTYNTAVTKASMVIQTILGYYVFIIFVFAIPIFRAIDLPGPSLPGLSLGQSRFLIALGLLTSFHFCLALQGGQFLFMARLVCAATGKDFLKQQSGASMRAVFWNANMGLAGLWTFITGILIAVNVGSGTLDMSFVSPPNVGRLPVMTIVTGGLMMVWAILGITFAVGRGAPPMAYFAGTAVLYVFGFLNFGLVQFGLIEMARAGPVVLHAGLVFMTVFLGPYFVNLAAKERDGNL